MLKKYTVAVADASAPHETHYVTSVSAANAEDAMELAVDECVEGGREGDMFALWCAKGEFDVIAYNEHEFIR